MAFIYKHLLYTYNLGKTNDAGLTAVSIELLGI